MVRFFDGIVPVQRPTKGSKGRETSFAGRRKAYVRVQPPTNWGPPRQVQVRWCEMRRGEVRHDSVQTSKYPLARWLDPGCPVVRWPYDFQGRAKLIWIHRSATNPGEKKKREEEEGEGESRQIDWPNDNDPLEDYEWERVGWRVWLLALLTEDEKKERKKERKSLLELRREGDYVLTISFFLSLPSSSCSLDNVRWFRWMVRFLLTFGDKGTRRGSSRIWVFNPLLFSFGINTAN